MRLDKWLWAARFFKTRTLASDAVSGGKVQLNGTRIKPSREVKIGDRLDVANSETHWELTVRALSDKRGPAPEARLLYEESQASIASREAQRETRQLVVDPAADLHGRPTKRDRRQINRFGGS
ncbi:RNA-binding S4 domain-containing protein [Dechloromonas denitrificans]|uniref:RNA-binding S4 domain-containing protein n=1 Tax=Dechloromonas denitrificans TaxID=281362 RepID=UPI001CF86F8F|nr:RNA-binding S4 domain-containing protein [Dechloromonas denitrificans]UCV03927.1 RNA-binding S4 domain-containing protein [Dechloromonas denitrificans]UCV08183.1 RNA-binding S4 domain-containing protein [Dechloromonas denitrificans]